MPVVDKDLKLEYGHRIEFGEDNRVVVESKAVECVAPIHEAIVLTYLRLSGCKVGLLMNCKVSL